MRNKGSYTLAPRRRHKFACFVMPLIVALATVFVLKAIRTARIIGNTAAVLSNPEFDPRSTANANAAEALLADTYPSKQSAVRALSIRLRDAIDKVSPKPAGFRLPFEDKVMGGESAVYDALRLYFPEVPVIPPGDQTPKAAGEVTIGLRIEEDHAKPPRRTARGNVQITITGVERATSLSARFVQCEWADDLAEYTRDHPGHTWLIARSNNLCASAGEARHQAEEAGADAILRLIAPRPQHNFAPLTNGVNPRITIRNDIRHQLPIADRFAQQFHRPYGTVCTEMILLDVSPGWIDNLQRRQADSIQRQESRTRTTAGSLAIVLVSILLAYVFANAMTRRYFTGRLRAVAIVFALTALMFVWSIA
jgi:hypothetical protein